MWERSLNGRAGWTRETILRKAPGGLRAAIAYFCSTLRTVPPALFFFLLLLIPSFQTPFPLHRFTFNRTLSLFHPSFLTRNSLLIQ